MSYILILIGCVFVNNVVLSQFMGICPFLGVSKQMKSSVGMGAAVIFVMICATAITYPVYRLLEHFGMEYLKTVAFILVIAMFVQLVEIVMKKMMPPLYKALGVYLPLITTNCAVLGVVTLNIQESYNFIESIANSFGAGLGFMLAMIMFSGVRERLEGNDFPKFWQGLPITLVAAAITACSFLGFTGVVENIFGA